MSYDPFDPHEHMGDYILEQWAIDDEHARYAELQAQQEQKIRILREGVEIDIGYSLRKLKYYMAELTPRRRSELEALLVRLNIIIPENDSRGIADLGKEYVNKTANLEKTAVDESAEQDLEKYLSKLTSEKREELEDILNRFREASTKLDELQKNIDSQKPKQKLLTTKQAIICWSIFFTVLILVGIITGFN